MTQNPAAQTRAWDDGDPPSQPQAFAPQRGGRLEGFLLWFGHPALGNDGQVGKIPAGGSGVGLAAQNKDPGR